MRVVGIEFLFPKILSLLQSDDNSSLSHRFILAPFAFLGHFQSDSNLSTPETLGQTYQGIEWMEIKYNQGIRTLPGRVYAQHSVYRVRKALGSHPIPGFLDLPFISSINAAVYTFAIIRKLDIWKILSWGLLLDLILESPSMFEICMPWGIQASKSFHAMSDLPMMIHGAFSRIPNSVSPPNLGFIVVKLVEESITSFDLYLPPLD
ncbi:hypothetical protein PIB30_037356 [Stylosanthes scabra]|uniref:Uncharacterized protein n=1 Tax=Stylosanthes scabra TaxID=79078 RepID=A0ABU6TDD5_9FABA|nr:hypothetical protein [Stylosanthes scabra]